MKKYPVLVALMANFDITQADIAKILDRDKSTVHHKINGNGNSTFSIAEAEKIVDYINEVDENNNWTVGDVFFSELVAHIQEKAS